MTHIDEFTCEVLQKELERRRELREELEKPKQLEGFDLGPLMKICSDYIDYIATDWHGDNDWDHYIYETAIETMYGKDVWDWINKKMAG